MSEVITQTFWSWEYDNMEEEVTLEVTKDEMLRRANEWYEYNSFEEIEEWMKDTIWDMLYEEREEKNADVEYWQSDD